MLGDRAPDLGIRASRAVVVVACLFTGLVVRLGYLQLVQHERYQRAAEDNRIRWVVRSAPRGVVRARGGELMVENRPAYAVEVTAPKRGPRGIRRPLSVTRVDSLVAAVAPVAGVDAAELKERLSDALVHIPRQMLLVPSAPYRLVAFVEEHQQEFPELQVRPRSQRHYRYGHLAAHVLGRLGEISAEELVAADRRAHYRRGDFVGRSGLEEAYEAWLRGKDGVWVMEVDARGREVRVLPEEENRDPVPGLDLHLSLDHGLQTLADSLLTGHKGAFVAVDPRNGDVLSMVSKPDYDLNLFAGGRIRTNDWVGIRDDPGRPLVHRAIAGLYPPASPWKLVTGISAIRRGLVHAGSRLPVGCTGGYRLGRRVFKCWHEGGHGGLTLVQAMERSCDVFFYQLGLDLRVPGMTDAGRNLGFGEPTGLEIGGEKSGFLPTEAWYDNRFGPDGWGKGVNLNLSIGQGELLVTPLQMAVIYGAILRNGEYFEPHLVHHVSTPAGRTVDIGPLTHRRTIDIGPEDLDFARKSLTAVVEGTHGTGNEAAVPGVWVGGKTGTAENPHGETHAWFVAVAPLEDPEVAVACIIEGGGHGGDVAAPMVGLYLRRLFSKDGAQ